MQIGSASGLSEAPVVPGYRLERKLGRGGEGVVFYGIKEGSESNDGFAIKTRRCFGLEAANEAIQEGLALARVTGPSNVAIHDVILSKAEDDLYLVHIVMDFFTGGA